MSIADRMSLLQKWAILTDQRYAYLTMQPAYEANILNKFADLLQKKLIYTSERPVIWSVKE